MNRSSPPPAAHGAPNTLAASSGPPARPAPPAPGPFGVPDAAVAAALSARASLAFASAQPGAVPAAGLLSPCIGVCRLDVPRHHCEGCLRTLDEIRAWGKSDDASRRAVWAAVACRAGIALPAPAEATGMATAAAAVPGAAAP